MKLNHTLVVVARSTIALFVAVVLLGAAGCGFISDAKNTELLDPAQQHLKKATTILEDVQEDKRIDNPTPEWADETGQKLDTALAELKSAQADTDRLPDSNGKKQYLRGLDSYAVGATSLKASIRWSSILVAGIDYQVKADRHLDDATNSGDSDKWPAARDQARAAVLGYEQAATLSKQADALNPSDWGKRQTLYCTKYGGVAGAYADYAVAMQAGRTSEADRLWKTCERLWDEAESTLPKSGAEAYSPDYLSLVDWDALEKGDELLNEAYDELGIREGTISAIFKP